MGGTITTREFDLIRDFIAKETSISLAEDKVYLVETRLSRIMVQEGIPDYFALHEALQDTSRRTLRDRVIDAMTTNETLWFRDSAPFDAFRDHLLPAYAAEISEGKRDKIRIWSAASSTGQEPYSLAMIFKEAVRSNPALKMEQLEIVASDLSDSALATARAGVYSGIAMDRGLPPEFRLRYFVPKGDTYEITDEIRNRVTFHKFNLQNSFITMGKFDIVLTRYVLIYFEDDFKREVLRKANGALEKGGVLFLGSSESLPEKTPGYALIRRGRATWFQKSEAQKTGVGLSEVAPQVVAPPSVPVTKPVPAAPASRLPLNSSKPANSSTPPPVQSSQGGVDEATSTLSEVMQRLKAMNDKHSKK